MKDYRLFISHSWTYSDEYERLKSLLKERPYFEFSDYSVPKDDPIHKQRNEQLYEAIHQKIKQCSAILVPAGVYATHSKWIGKEIEMARKESKPIIAIKPWGSKAMSQLVQDNADDIVGWNADSIVSAIRKLT